jgi:thioredoxin reductase (NADPH)
MGRPWIDRQGEKLMQATRDEIVVYGTNWCPDCKRSKQFLGDQRIQYAWVDIEHDTEAMLYVEQVNKGMRRIPTIQFQDGSVLVEPSNAELAEKLGLKTKATREFYDVIIIGGGPAGLTAAIYTAREGLDTLVIEKSAPGGQAGVTQMIENYPGFDQGISGDEFAKRLTNQAKRFGVEILQAQAVTDIQSDGRYREVTTSDGSTYCATTILIATGARYRRMNVPGEDELIGVNLHFCATCDGAFYKGKEVLVVGGGNSGFEEGLFLTKFADKVRIVEYEPEVKASRILQDKVAGRDDMEVIVNHAVQEFVVAGDGSLKAVKVVNRESGKVEEWHPDGVFVFVGLVPNADFLPPEIERDRFGFVVTDKTLETSVKGIFAAGDVRKGATAQAAAAAGEGPTVALMMRQYIQEN